MTVPREALDFREHAFNLSPAWLQGENSERMVGVFGLMFDLLAEATHRGTTARFLDAPTSPTDAPDKVGGDYAMPRLMAETDAEYRARLRNAWTAWREAGTDVGMVNRYAEFGGLSVTIKENHTAGWDWDGDTSYWSRFWVVIETHPWSGPDLWSDGGVWDDGTVWDLTASREEVETLRKIARHWKIGRAICHSIIVVHTPGSWSGTPDGTWDQWANRDTGAAYISG